MADISSLLDKQYERMDFADLADAPVDALSGVSAADAEALRKAFNVKTIGEFGRNKYVVAAVAIAALAGPKQ